MNLITYNHQATRVLDTAHVIFMLKYIKAIPGTDSAMSKLSKKCSKQERKSVAFCMIIRNLGKKK